MPTQELLNVQKVWDRMSSSPIYRFLLSSATLESASPGSFKARLQLGPNHMNSRGTLHGSVSATIVDWAGGLAIASHGLEQTGVSTDIHVIYLSGAKEGTWVTVEGTVSKLGNSLAFTAVTILKDVEGEGGEGRQEVVVQGTHTKYIKRF